MGNWIKNADNSSNAKTWSHQKSDKYIFQDDKLGRLEWYIGNQEKAQNF